jgi:hypothetical protein
VPQAQPRAKFRINAAGCRGFTVSSDALDCGDIEAFVADGRKACGVRVCIETRVGFDIDDVDIKARLDFGANAIG